jgi:integrase
LNLNRSVASAVFSWGLKQEVVEKNPVQGVERHPTVSRERVLADSEIARFWSAFDEAGLIAGTALKCILLTGQRPGEVGHMRREHLVDGWWEMPGAPDSRLGWPGTKNGASHRVWLAAPVLAVMAPLMDDAATGWVFTGPRGRPINGLDAAMRAACTKLGVERATPHDLRRTFSSRVTGLGFGRDAMNRVTNHKEGGIASVYDRHSYAGENKGIMEAVAARIMALATGDLGAASLDDSLEQFLRAWGRVSPFFPFR